MNRRGFFARTVGALVAAVVGPRLSGVWTVQSIDVASYKFWKAQPHPRHETAFDNLRTSMRETYNRCSSGLTPDWDMMD